MHEKVHISQRRCRKDFIYACGALTSKFIQDIMDHMGYNNQILKNKLSNTERLKKNRVGKVAAHLPLHASAYSSIHKRRRRRVCYNLRRGRLHNKCKIKRRTLKIFLMMSIETPKQEVVVHCDNGSLERIFSVHIVQQTSGSSNKALDMPLIDITPNEMFVSATSVDDCFNNNTDTLLHTKFAVANSFNKKHEEIDDLSTIKRDDQPEKKESRQNHTMNDQTSDYCQSTEDDISGSLSEYLVFHKKVDATAGLISKSGCYVKLQRLSECEIKVMCEEKSLPKRRRLHSVDISPTKKLKPIAFRRDSAPNLRVTRSRNTPKFEDVSNCGPVSKRRNTTYDGIVKRTGKNSRTIPLWTKEEVIPVDPTNTTRVSRSRTKIASKCAYRGNDNAEHQTYQQSAEDEVSKGRGIVLVVVRDRTRPGSFICVRIPERCGIKQCSVRLERLSTFQSTAPRRRECDETSYLERTKEVTSGSAFINVETLLFGETNSEFKDLQKVDAPNCTVVSLLPDITATTLTGDESNQNVEQRNLPVNSNEFVVPNQQSVKTSPVVAPNCTVVSLLPDITATTWTGDESNQNVEQRNLPVNSNEFVVPNQQSVKTSLFNDIEALEFPNVINVEDSSALDTLIVEAAHSMSLLPTETNSSHASRLINSPDVTTLPLCAQEETAGSIVKETDPMCDTVDDDNCSVASDISLFASDSETLYSPDRKTSLQPTDEWTLDKYRIPKKPPVCKEVDQILAATIKNSPIMVSPIKDPPNLSGTKRKRNEFRNERPLQPKIMKKTPAKSDEAIRKKLIKEKVQPNAMKSRRNTFQVQSESEYNAKSQQQPSQLRVKGISKWKSMVSDEAVRKNWIKEKVQPNAMKSRRNTFQVQSDSEYNAKSQQQPSQIRVNDIMSKWKSMESDEAIRKNRIKEKVQPNAMKSRRNTFQVQSELKYNAKSQQQPSQLRVKGISKWKSMESDEAIRKNWIKEKVQPNAMKSRRNTFQLQSESEYNAKSQQQTSQIRVNDMSKWKSMESDKPTSSAEKLNNSRNITVEVKSIEPQKATGRVEKFNDSRNNDTLEEKSIESQKPTGTVESRDNGMSEMLEEKFIELEKITKTVEQQSNRIEHKSSEAVSELNESKHPDAASSGNIDDGIKTGIGTSGTTYKSNIDFKNLGKIVVNVSDQNSRRTVSIPNTDAPAGTDSVSSTDQILDVVLNLFENPCNEFLAGNVPCKESECQFCRQSLPSADKIVEELRTVKDDKINWIYKNFIAAYQPIFLRYFPDICNLFGLRKMEDILKLSIKDCEKYGRRDFYKFIHRALMECGKSYVDAVMEMNELVEPCEDSIAIMTEIFFKLDHNEKKSDF